MNKKLYKTAEFADLCGVSKHTLFHYDQIGLLSPIRKEANGYRYYSVDQYEKFNLISMLKEVGTPLNEIKDYLTNQSNELFVDFLKQRLESMEEKINKLKKMQYLLAHTIASMEKVPAFQHAGDDIHFIQCEEEYLIATKVGPFDDAAEDAMVKSIKNHLQYCSQRNLNIGLQLNEMLLNKQITQNDFETSYYYSKLFEKTEDPRLFIKPKGTYAVKIHRGNYDTLKNTYRTMKEQIEDYGHTIIGNIYEEDLVDFHSEKNPDKYILKISIEVEPAQLP